MRKIAIGIVIYNPTPSLISRIDLSLAAGFTLYIFDNSPQNGTVEDFCRSHNNCKYITCGKNVGLGIGISSVCAQAFYDSYPALLFFDQDTVFDKSTLDFIEEFYAYNANLTNSYSAIVFNAKNIGDVVAASGAPNDKFIFRDVPLAINSGSLYFLENLKRINWHNETYFVDCVDYEFCLNSNIHNLKIGECSLTPGFDHVSEQGDFKYKIFGKTYSMRQYPMRRIIDYILASLRIIISSVRTRNFAFTVETCRVMAGYLVYLFRARLIKGASMIFKWKI